MSLFVVPEPAPNTATVLTASASPDGVIVRDAGGRLNMACGACKQTLVEDSIGVRQFVGVLFKCTKCGAFNSTRQ